MSYDVQVTVDSRDPHTQAVWWAETLGWEVEPSDEDFIRRMVETGQASESDTLVFDGTLVWASGAAIRDGSDPGRPRVLFLAVPEPKTVKNRMHFDVRVGAAREDVASALVARGASILDRHRQGPFEWVVMADPEGNEFCLA